jgi:hypothetical protein
MGTRVWEHGQEPLLVDSCVPIEGGWFYSSRLIPMQLPFIFE